MWNNQYKTRAVKLEKYEMGKGGVRSFETKKFADPTSDTKNIVTTTGESSRRGEGERY